VASGSGNLAWFKGPTVLDALDSFSQSVPDEADLRFPVQDVYDVEGLKTAVGRVEAGVLKAGQEVYVLPAGRKSRVSSIRKFMEDGITEAPPGDCVGITVEGDGLKRGDIVVDRVTSTVTDTLHANVFWLVDKDYRLGIPLMLRCATQEAKGRIERIYRRFDPASIEVVEKDAKEIKPAEVAEVEIRLERPVVVDRFGDIPEMGRFVLEHMGHPVAGGIII
jgi:translation elongation factor EF-1alpha